MDYVFRNHEEKINVVKGKGHYKHIPFGDEMLESSLLYDEITRELSFDFHQCLIRLNQCSRNFIKDTDGCNVLYLSDTDGGYPRKGVAVQKNSEIKEHPNLRYVDLMINEKNIKQGKLSIFSHELGHVMMENIWPSFPVGKSVKPHTSMAVADYFLAFYEGFGEHFQRLVYDNVDYYNKLQREQEGFRDDISKLWHSKIDKDLRLTAVLNNQYIHKKLLPRVDTFNMELQELIVLEHLSPIFDKIKLKNAQEMLSCEGVIATLFYRINTNKDIQCNYAWRDFYKDFLIAELPEGTDGRDIFNPFENVILKNFYVWSKLKGKINDDSIIFIDFIEEWLKCFPEDREELIKIFISTTIGKTITNKLAKLYEEVAYYGLIGDIKNYLECCNSYNAFLDSLCEQAIEGKINLRQNIGDEFWITNKDFKMKPWMYIEEEFPLRVNVNTASIYELCTFKQISYNLAVQLVKKRDEQGYLNKDEIINIIGKEI